MSEQLNKKLRSVIAGFRANKMGARLKVRHLKKAMQPLAHWERGEAMATASAFFAPLIDASEFRWNLRSANKVRRIATIPKMPKKVKITGKVA